MKKINILGSGVMGSQIANLFSIMGYEVNIWNRTRINKDNLLRQKKLILKLLKISDNNGIIKIIDNFQEFSNNITIECLAEKFELKKKYLEDVSQKVSKEIFTNSSSIQTNKIGKKINLMHFFNPISLRIVEFNGSVKFGEETAVLAGNSLLTIACAILSDKKLNLKDKTKSMLIKKLSKCAGHAGIAGGQFLDLKLECLKDFNIEIYGINSNIFMTQSGMAGCMFA